MSWTSRMRPPPFQPTQSSQYTPYVTELENRFKFVVVFVNQTPSVSLFQLIKLGLLPPTSLAMGSPCSEANMRIFQAPRDIRAGVNETRLVPLSTATTLAKFAATSQPKPHTSESEKRETDIGIPLERGGALFGYLVDLGDTGLLAFGCHVPNGYKVIRTTPDRIMMETKLQNCGDVAPS